MDISSFQNNDIATKAAAASCTDVPPPKERLEQFAFCVRSGEMAIVEWRGVMERIARKAEQGHEILIKVRPRLVSRAGVAFTPYSTVEHWQWDGTTMKLARLTPGKGLKAVFVD